MTEAQVCWMALTHIEMETEYRNADNDSKLKKVSISKKIQERILGDDTLGCTYMSPYTDTVF